MASSAQLDDEQQSGPMNVTAAIEYLDENYFPETRHLLLQEMDEPAVAYLVEHLDLDFLQRGAQDIAKRVENSRGKLSQVEYDLIKSGRLSPETLGQFKPQLMRKKVTEKYWFLYVRYYTDDQGNVCDKSKNGKYQYPPIRIFDKVMATHLRNNHLSYRQVFDNVNTTYGNITRDLCQICLSYCSICNPSKVIKGYGIKGEHIYKAVLPLERVHLEIFKPFDGKRIEGKYQYILYCRDYLTRVVWILPLKKKKYKYLLKALSEFILSMIRIPIYIETSTIDKQDMFDICQSIAEEYHLFLGLGCYSSENYHFNGIKQFKKLLNAHRDECLADWKMCLRYGSYLHNRTYNRKVFGIPNDLFYSTLEESGKKFKAKRRWIISNMFAHNVVQLAGGKGMLYLEDESGVSKEDANAYEQEEGTDEEYGEFEQQQQHEVDTLSLFSDSSSQVPLDMPTSPIASCDGLASSQNNGKSNGSHHSIVIPETPSSKHKDEIKPNINGSIEI